MAVALLIDFKKCADKTFRRQVLDGEADGLRGLRKSLVAKRLTAARAPSCRKQLGGCTVIEFGHHQEPYEEGSSIIWTKIIQNNNYNMGVLMRGFQSDRGTFLPALRKGSPAFNVLFCLFLCRDAQVRTL